MSIDTSIAILAAGLGGLIVPVFAQNGTAGPARAKGRERAIWAGASWVAA
jgi:hypothetical protein